MSQVCEEYTDVWRYILYVEKFAEASVWPGPEVTRQAQTHAHELSEKFLALRPVPQAGCAYVSEVCKGLNNLSSEDKDKFNEEMMVLEYDLGSLKSWFSVFACIQ